jgi:DNA modification methylase
VALTPYYADASVTLYHGDCREILPHVEADVMVTDPPFGMAYSSGWQARPIAGDSSVAVRDEALAIWGNRPALVFGRWSEPRPAATRARLIWDKGEWPGMGDLALPWGPSDEEVYVLGHGFVGKRSGSVLRIDRMVGATAHPNEKPQAILAQLIAKCPPGVVVDPFSGVGSTALAAKNMGRRAIGIEIEERYCEIAAKRLQQGVLFGPSP